MSGSKPEPTASTATTSAAAAGAAASRSRVACLLVADLPLQAALRAEPELAGRPLVVTTGAGPRAEVLAASEEARACGALPGQSLGQARALLPELEARPASPSLERAARDALLDVALSLSPRAEPIARGSGLFAAEGAVVVDANGIAALHASESRFASVLQSRSERAGLASFVALASSRSVAHLAARKLALEARFAPRSRERETTRVLSPRKQLAFLAPLPLDLLDPDDETAEALSRFGLRTIRDLLGLSPRDLAIRTGPAILELIARARGEQSEPPLRAPRTLEFEEGIDLEWPIALLAPLFFVLRGLVARLCERLALRALGGDALRLELRLESGGRDARRIALASPTRDEQTLLHLIRQALESKPPAAAVEGVLLACEGVPLRQEQLDFFRPRGPDPNLLDQALAALGAICGAERVGAPALLDEHHPDAFALERFVGRSLAERSGSDTTRREDTGPRLSLRAIRPPAHAEVRIEGGRPVFVRSTVARGEVLEVAGPWRTTGHWWSETGQFAIDHYDVQTSDGNVVRLRFDWRQNQWQVDGLYD